MTDISLKHTDISIERGSHLIIPITFSPNNATNKTLSLTVSSDGIVTARQESGEIIVTGVSAGNTTITATATDGSGVCATIDVKVTPIEVESIDVYPNRRIMKHGQTAYISAMVFPCNADDRSITWESSNHEIATVNSFGKITAHERDGTTTITARSASGNITDTCFVVVDERPQAIVERDGTEYSKIVFPDGKVWNCINRDLINDNDLNMSDSFYQRFYDNTYQTKVIDEKTADVHYYKPMIEYTDDEIKLIYTIDPYGLAAYVSEYASNNYESPCSVQEMLEGILEYKDYVFRLLYKRSPKYYARYPSGNWYVTTDKSDLKAVLSESEYLFGFHTLWDKNSIYEILATAFDLLVSVSGIDSTTMGKWVTKILKVALNVWAGKAPFELRDVAEGIAADALKDEITDEISAWATYISLMQSLDEIKDVFADRPQIYLPMLAFSSDNNNQDINYNIVFKLANGENYTAKELYSLTQ